MPQKPKFWIGAQGIETASLAKWAGEAGCNLFFGCCENDWQAWRAEVRRLGCFYLDLAREFADPADPHCVGWLLEQAYRFNKINNRPFLPDLVAGFRDGADKSKSRPDFWMPAVFDGHAWQAVIDCAGDAGGLVQDVMGMANAFITCLYPMNLAPPNNLPPRPAADYLTRLKQIRSAVSKNLTGAQEPWLVLLECASVAGHMTPQDISAAAQEVIKAGVSGIIWNASNHREDNTWIGDVTSKEQFAAVCEVGKPLRSTFPPAVNAPTLAEGWEQRMPEVISTMASELTRLREEVDSLKGWRERLVAGVRKPFDDFQKMIEDAASGAARDVSKPQGNVEWGNGANPNPRPPIQGVKPHRA